MHVHSTIALALLSSAAHAQNVTQATSPTGVNQTQVADENANLAGGFFGGLSLTGVLTSGINSPSNGASATSTGTEGNTGLTATDKDGGSGAYKAAITSDPGLPNHAIYAPKEAPPAGTKFPFIAFGNGGCLYYATMYANLLIEIASHGYVVTAQGAPDAGVLSLLKGQSRVTEVTQAIDWITKGAKTPGFKYSYVDTDKIITSGQSCGGLEAYSAGAFDDRVKEILLFNSGTLTAEKRPYVKFINKPIGYILGGPTDVAYQNGLDDYNSLLPDAKKFLASLDMGHRGTYGASHGGKAGELAVAYLNWHLKGNETAKALFQGADNYFAKQKWNVTSANNGL